MNISRTRFSSSRSDTEAATREILKSVAHVLLANGASRDDLAREFQQACRQAARSARTSLSGRLTSLEHVHVISHWYRDPDYLEANGEPRALSLRGPGASLATLVKRVFPRANPTAVVAKLVTLGAVRKEGTRFVTTGRYVSFAEQRKEGLDWLLTVLQALSSTVAHNITCLPKDRLFARSAFNPKFPASALPGFHLQLRTDGDQFLRDRDGAMHRQEVRRANEATTQLGVVLFAFEKPLITGQLPSHSSRSSGPTHSTPRQGRRK